MDKTGTKSYLDKQMPNNVNPDGYAQRFVEDVVIETGSLSKA